jgi:hypothetical protein
MSKYKIKKIIMNSPIWEVFRDTGDNELTGKERKQMLLELVNKLFKSKSGGEKK